MNLQPAYLSVLFFLLIISWISPFKSMRRSFSIIVTAVVSILLLFVKSGDILPNATKEIANVVNITSLIILSVLVVVLIRRRIRVS